MVVQLWHSASSIAGSWRSIPAVTSPSCSALWVDGLLLRHASPYTFTSVPTSVCQPACESCNTCCTVHYMACRSVGSNASSKGAWPHTAANGDLARSSGSARAVAAAATAAAAGSSVHSSTSEDVLGALQAKAAAVPSVWGSADQQQQQHMQRQQQGEQGWPDQAVADAQAAAAAAAAAAEEIGVRVVPSEVSAVQHLPTPNAKGRAICNCYGCASTATCSGKPTVHTIYSATFTCHLPLGRLGAVAELFCCPVAPGSCWVGTPPCQHLSARSTLYSTAWQCLTASLCCCGCCSLCCQAGRSSPVPFRSCG